MANSFAEWLRSARRGLIDPVTDEPYTQGYMATLMNISEEKWSSWETGRRTPSTPEDIHGIARVLDRSVREVLEARGFDLGDLRLSPREQEALAVLRQWSDEPDLQEQAIRLLRALPPPTRRRSPRLQREDLRE